jgi:disulfide bond formation protein DsbB
MTLPNSRLVNGVGFLICVASLLFAIFYLERTLFLDPCPLCIIDRVILTCMAVVFLIAMLHNPSRLGQRIYGIVNLMVVVTGIAVAGRHVWLQHLPADEVPECGAGLSYMLENFPLHKTLQKVLQGSGECAEIQWEFLSLSIPEQTLILFVMLASIILVQTLRRSG